MWAFRIVIQECIPSTIELSKIHNNICDSRKIGIVKIINPYRIRARKNAP